MKFDVLPVLRQLQELGLLMKQQCHDSSLSRIFVITAVLVVRHLLTVRFPPNYLPGFIGLLKRSHLFPTLLNNFLAEIFPPRFSNSDSTMGSVSRGAAQIMVKATKDLKFGCYGVVVAIFINWPFKDAFCSKRFVDIAHSGDVTARNDPRIRVFLRMF